MATDMTGATHKGYTFVEIFCGPVSSLIDLDRDTSIPYPSYSETQIGFFQGKSSSKFVENKLVKIRDENGDFSHQWVNWSFINVTTRKHKDGIKKLGLTHSIRPHSWNRNPWNDWETHSKDDWEKSPITNVPGMVSFFVSLHHINVFNQEIERLYKENIGEPPFPLDEYFVELKHFEKDNFDLDKYYPSLSFRDESSTETCSAWFHRNTTDYIPSQHWGNRNPYRYANNLASPLYHFVEGEYLQSLVPFQELKTPKEIFTAIFGEHNYRKDLMKACFQKTTNTYKIKFVSAFKDYVPIDWIIDMLNCDNKDSFLGWDQNVLFESRPYMLFYFHLGDAEEKALPSLLNALTLTQRKRLVKDLQAPNSKGEFADSMTVGDALYAWHTLTEEYNCAWNQGDLNVRSWQDLHDYLTHEVTIRTVSDDPIKQVPLAQKIDALAKTNELTFVLPESTHTVIKWGKTMHHCIGSYTRDAKNGKYVLLGLMENNVMQGNAMIETKSKNVVQILGKRNEFLEKDMLNRVSNTLIKENILPANAFDNAYGFKN